jgi:hypothetical protein
MVEDQTLEQLLNAFSAVTNRTPTDEGTNGFPRMEGSPDYVLGFDGRALGIELAEVRDVSDAWSYYEEASRIANKKHTSYEKCGLFANPIVLILHSAEPPLFDLQRELVHLESFVDFVDLDFIEVWGIDFSDDYYTPGHPYRMPDLFCFKPRSRFGFHRIEAFWDRKPFG